MNERRLESRFLCADLVRMDWMAGEDEAGATEAVLEDISALGACVQVESRIPLGLSVTLSMGGIRIDGYVTYCVFRDYGYFVGVLFTEETKWSSELFEPRHLTSLNALAQHAEPTAP